MNKIYRVGTYYRLSDEDREKTSDFSESIKNQRNLLIDYINIHNNFILVDEYCDEDLSGAGTYRPEFERLINDCKNGKIDIVLCKSQSRFSRDMEIIEKYLHNYFLEWNVRFISIADNADTSNPGNKKSRQINGLVNEWYLEDVSNNIRSAFKSKMQQGEYISPFAPYGYLVSKTNNNKIEIDYDASLIVKDIFNLYLKGYGYKKIADILNYKNIPSPSYYKYKKGIKQNVVSNKNRCDIKWSSNAIKTILTNEVYIGNLVQGKRTTISYKNHKIINKDKSMWIKRCNTHDAIIDSKTFYKVKEEIKKRTKISTKTNMVHIFSGKVFCGNCNKKLRKKNSKNHSYLVCENCINKKSIRYDYLEKIILECINNIIIKNFDIPLLKCELNKRYKSNTLELLKKTKEKITKQKMNNKEYLKNIYIDKVKGIINNNQFKELLKTFNQELYKTNNQINELNLKIKKYSEKINLNKYHQIKTLNRYIVDEFIEKIYIGPINSLNTRDIKIIWNIKCL